MKTSAVLTSKDTSGDTKQKSITYINPAATDSAVLAFVRQANNVLTDNIYVGTKRVTTKDLDTEADTKVEPTLTIGTWDTTMFIAQITYNGDGRLFSSVESENNDIYSYLTADTDGETGQLVYSVRLSGGSSSSDYDEAVVYVHADEGTNYTAKTVSSTIDIS